MYVHVKYKCEHWQKLLKKVKSIIIPLLASNLSVKGVNGCFKSQVPNLFYNAPLQYQGSNIKDVYPYMSVCTPRGGGGRGSRHIYVSSGFGSD